MIQNFINLLIENYVNYFHWLWVIWNAYFLFSIIIPSGATLLLIVFLYEYSITKYKKDDLNSSKKLFLAFLVIIQIVYVCFSMFFISKLVIQLEEIKTKINDEWISSLENIKDSNLFLNPLIDSFIVIVISSLTVVWIHSCLEKMKSKNKNNKFLKRTIELS